MHFDTLPMPKGRRFTLQRLPPSPARSYAIFTSLTLDVSHPTYTRSRQQAQALVQNILRSVAAPVVMCPASGAHPLMAFTAAYRGQLVEVVPPLVCDTLLQTGDLQRGIIPAFTTL